MASQAIENIEREEGFRGTVYKDSLGFDTLGYGTKMPIIEEEAELILIYRFEIMQKELDEKLKNRKIETKAMDILYEMAYQLGVPRVLKFKNMLNALENGDFLEASKQMLDSAWHRQTPERCERLAERMRLLHNGVREETAN